MDDVFAMADEMRPMVLVVDSIQTMYMNDVSGSAGTPSQVSGFAPRNQFDSIRSVANGVVWESHRPSFVHARTVMLLSRCRRRSKSAGRPSA